MVVGTQDDGPDLSRMELRTPSDKRPVFILDNRIESRELFASSREITISHGYDIYRLRLTSQNILILTK